MGERARPTRGCRCGDGSGRWTGRLGGGWGRGGDGGGRVAGGFRGEGGGRGELVCAAGGCGVGGEAGFVGHVGGGPAGGEVVRDGADVAAEEDGGGADGGGGDGGVADVAAVHCLLGRAPCGDFAGGAAQEDLVYVGEDGGGANASEGGEAEGVVGAALGCEAVQVGGGLFCVAGVEDG